MTTHYYAELGSAPTGDLGDLRVFVEDGMWLLTIDYPPADDEPVYDARDARRLAADLMRAADWMDAQA